MLTLLTLLLSTVVNKAAIFAPTNNTTSTRQQLPFLSRDCSVISYIGRPDNENHYADHRPNKHYQNEYQLSNEMATVGADIQSTRESRPKSAGLVSESVDTYTGVLSFVRHLSDEPSELFAVPSVRCRSGLIHHLIIKALRCCLDDSIVNVILYSTIERYPQVHFL